MITRKTFLFGVALMTILSVSLFSFTANAIDDESNLCLHDGRGAKNAMMPNCQIPSDLGGAVSGAAGVDGGYFVSMGNYKEFKASRRRVSDFNDVSWASMDLAKRGLFVGVSGGEGVYAPPTPFMGIRLNSSPHVLSPFQTLPVVAHGECRYIYNTSGNDIFVPFKTQKEWVAFLNNLPHGVTANTCSISCPGTCDNFIVFGPTSMKAGDRARDDGSLNNWFRVELPYAPTGATWPTGKGAAEGINRHTFRYTCTQIDAVPDSSEEYCVEHATKTESCSEGSHNCTCDSHGICTRPNTYCSKAGSRCVTSEKNWDETWMIPVGSVRAGVVHMAGGNLHTGWEPAALQKSSGSVSKRVGGSSRPCTGDNLEKIAQGDGFVCAESTSCAPGSKGCGGKKKGKPKPPGLSCF